MPSSELNFLLPISNHVLAGQDPFAIKLSLAFKNVLIKLCLRRESLVILPNYLKSNLDRESLFFCG